MFFNLVGILKSGYLCNVILKTEKGGFVKSFLFFISI